MAYRWSKLCKFSHCRKGVFLILMTVMVLAWKMGGKYGNDGYGQGEEAKMKSRHSSFAKSGIADNTNMADKRQTPLEDLLGETKHFINNSGGHIISDQGDSDKKLHILIFSVQRSGSSFLGELFKQNPDMFYAFEPVRPLTFDVLDGKLSKGLFDVKAKEKLYDFFRCRNATLRFIVRQMNQGLPRKSYKNVDYSSRCREKRHIAVKEIRFYDLKSLRTFAEDPSLNFKLIHLVRDPRAIMNSRSNSFFPNHDFLRKGVPWDEVTDLCKSMVENLNVVLSAPDWLRGKYILLRYEDVASQPLEMAKRIYDFVGLELHDDVTNWLKKNTQEERGGALSTSRNSTERIVAWKQEMPFNQVEDVQLKCWRAMEILGYALVTHEINMKSDGSFINDYSSEFVTFPYLL